MDRWQRAGDPATLPGVVAVVFTDRCFSTGWHLTGVRGAVV